MKAVIYYSYSNNTRKIAKLVSERLRCDLFELEPATPYPAKYEDVVELGEKEETKNARPTLKDYPNLDEYETIVICVPCWWHTLAPVMISYLESKTLVDKRIYCITTNGGYGNGECKQTLEFLCQKSKVMSILDVPFDEDELEIRQETIEEWISAIK